jgi:uncharacterized protein (TIGR02596 family)
MRFFCASLGRRKGGFSLIEMLVVISIIAIITSFAVPAFSKLVKGPTLNQASQMLTNQLSLARQYATTKNRSVEVRFLRYADPEVPGEGPNSGSQGHFRAIQLMEVLEAGTGVPLGKTEYFPQSIVMSPDSRSSLFDSAANPTQEPKTPNSTTDPMMPRGINQKYKYVSFRFLPNGSTTLSPTANWFITVLALQDQTANTALPPNFFTLQIDPVSGTTRGFRPNLN